jgi:hypothetical protein
MGYTHYWNYTTQVGDTKNFKEVKRELLMMKKKLPEFSQTAGGYHHEHPITLRNWEGKGLPEINDTEIAFNGDGKKGLDHESFVFEFKEESLRFGFCKTARKPYDMFVCLSLISLGNHLEGFNYSSDGELEDWQPAIDFYKEMFGEPILKFKEEVL